MAEPTLNASNASGSMPARSGSISGGTTTGKVKESQSQTKAQKDTAEKKSAKEEKAARRAAKVADRGGLPEGSTPVKGPPQVNSSRFAGAPADNKGKGDANRRAGPSTTAQHDSNSTSAAALPLHTVVKKQAGDGIESSNKAAQQHDPTVSLFGNVSNAKSHSAQVATLVSASYRSSIHPSVLRLATQLAEYKLMGADTRATALLLAMADVIRDYATPRGEALNRDLLKIVSSQVGHLVDARALGTSQGVAVRYLKYEISVVSADLTEDEAKEHLLERIDHFIRDRIVYASKIIRAQAGNKIKDGDVVMTFARSSVVEGALLAAWKRGVKFEVIVVDARPLLEGRALLSVLLAAGIPCAYGLISSLSSLMPRADLLLLGTSALLANGALYSRAGTASCAMMAKEKGIPVIVCCETYKFSERVQLDSFVQNEAGNPQDLLLADEELDSHDKRGLLSVGEWTKTANLSVVNLLYDVTPPKYISAVASEVGLSGPESVGVILRDYKNVLYGV